MGTETDQQQGKPAIPLSLAHQLPVGTLGFFLTKEGREFLRGNFEVFLRRAKYGERKVASIIADIDGNPEVSIKKIERIRSTLRRWNRDKQGELYPADQKENEKMMARLEREMLAVPEIREILTDCWSSNEKHQIGEALARFYYRKTDLNSGDFTKYLQANYEGIYREFTAWEHPVGVGTEQYQYLKTGGSVFYRLQVVPNTNFMLAQKFSKPPGDIFDISDPSFVRTLHNGFAFPMTDGSLHMNLFRLGPSSSRAYEVLESGMSQHRIPESFDTTKKGNRTWRANYQSFNASSEIVGRETEEVIWESIEQIPNVDKLLKTLDQRKWIL